MKAFAGFLLAIAVATGLPVAGRAADTFNWAEITKFVNDVKTIDPTLGAHPSKLNEMLHSQQSVKTGVNSRIELLFNDKTITRLGSNTQFSYSAGTRNMSLEGGAMLLQVPKGIGGAKIRSPAVTAAITGTTIIFEVGKGYTKLTVIEGESWLSSNTDPGNRVLASAGQEINAPDGKPVPPAVSVNLKAIEAGSILFKNAHWSTPIDLARIDFAPAGKLSAAEIKTQVGILFSQNSQNSAGFAAAIAEFVKKHPGSIAEIVKAALGAVKGKPGFDHFECEVVKDALVALKGSNVATDPNVVAEIVKLVENTVKDNSTCTCDIIKDAINDLQTPNGANIPAIAEMMGNVVQSIPADSVPDAMTCAVEALETKSADGIVTNIDQIATFVNDVIQTPGIIQSLAVAIISAVSDAVPAAAAAIISATAPTLSTLPTGAPGGQSTTIPPLSNSSPTPSAPPAPTPNPATTESKMQ